MKTIFKTSYGKQYAIRQKQNKNKVSKDTKQVESNKLNLPQQTESQDKNTKSRLSLTSNFDDKENLSIKSNNNSKKEVSEQSRESQESFKKSIITQLYSDLQVISENKQVIEKYLLSIIQQAEQIADKVSSKESVSSKEFFMQFQNLWEGLLEISYQDKYKIFEFDRNLTELDIVCHQSIQQIASERFQESLASISEQEDTIELSQNQSELFAQNQNLKQIVWGLQKSDLQQKQAIQDLKLQIKGYPDKVNYLVQQNQSLQCQVDKLLLKEKQLQDLQQILNKEIDQNQKTENILYQCYQNIESPSSISKLKATKNNQSNKYYVNQQNVQKYLQNEVILNKLQNDILEEQNSIEQIGAIQYNQLAAQSSSEQSSDYAQQFSKKSNFISSQQQNNDDDDQLSDDIASRSIETLARDLFKLVPKDQYQQQEDLNKYQSNIQEQELATPTKNISQQKDSADKYSSFEVSPFHHCIQKAYNQVPKNEELQKIQSKLRSTSKLDSLLLNDDQLSKISNSLEQLAQILSKPQVSKANIKQLSTFQKQDSNIPLQSLGYKQAPYQNAFSRSETGSSQSSVLVPKDLLNFRQEQEEGLFWKTRNNSMTNVSDEEEGFDSSHGGRSPNANKGPQLGITTQGTRTYKQDVNTQNTEIDFDCHVDFSSYLNSKSAKHKAEDIEYYLQMTNSAFPLSRNSSSHSFQILRANSVPQY